MIKRINTVFGEKDIDMVDNHDVPDMPKTLYKYRDWGNQYHSSLLKDNQVFFASPSSFNDPFDCGIEIAYHLLQTDEKLRQEYFRLVVDRYKPHLSAENKAKEVNRLIDEKRYMDDQYMAHMHKQSLSKLNQKYGVLSLTPINDNILMWSHYANSHKGFCVGMDSEKLYESIGGSLGTVNYSDSYPEISPNMDLVEQMILQTRSKAHFWGYELEYRHIKNIENERIFTLVPDTITEVILGAAISIEHKTEILDVVKAKHPTIKVFQSIPKIRAFEMQFEQIL
jgi:hypothetical protein